MLTFPDEHSVIKRGENKVSTHLRPPVHKEETIIIAFRGHLLVVTNTASLWSAEKAAVTDAEQIVQVRRPAAEMGHYAIARTYLSEEKKLFLPRYWSEAETSLRVI